jgi:hypothetical protein
VAAALQIWSATFSKAFDSLPAPIRDAVQRKVDEMGARLGNFPHQRLQGRPEFKLRVGDYASCMKSTLTKAASICTTSLIDVRFTGGRINSPLFAIRFLLSVSFHRTSPVAP